MPTPPRPPANLTRLPALLLCLGLATGLLTGCAAHGGAKTASAASSGAAAPTGSARAAAGGRQSAIATIPCPDKIPPAPTPLPQSLQDAVAAYDGGRFADAIPALESARTDGSADGIMLYRLAFCYKTVRNDNDLAQKSYESSRQALEAKEASGSATLEDYFYLVNSLLALSRDADSKTAALRAVERIEKCSLPVGADGISAFRVGKLYGDAGLSDRQVAWYGRALAEFEKEPNPVAAYVERAASLVVASDPDRAELSAAVADIEKLHSLHPSDASLAFQLTLARIQSGDFDGAKRSLQELEPMAGARADDLTYLNGMITKARRMSKAGHAIPGREEDGRTYGSLSREEIDSRMKEIAQTGNTLLTAKIEEGDAVVEERGPQKNKVTVPSPALLARIDAVQGRLLALSLEVVRRGLSIQEIAFGAGMSPLVLQDWKAQWIMIHREPEKPPETPAEAPPQAPPAGS